MQQAQTPHGGKLVDLIVGPKRAEEIKKQSVKWLSLNLRHRQICDLELLLNGGFSPLKSFLNQSDYESVCKVMRLKNGLLWPIPICLDVTEEFEKELKLGEYIALRDKEGVMLAALKVEEKYRPDLDLEARSVFDTDDPIHPGVNYIKRKVQPVYITGKLEGLQLPCHYDFQDMRQTPVELRKSFETRGWTKIVAFQTRNPMHRAHVEMTTTAAREAEANLLIQPTVGMTKPGDVDHFTRVRIYKLLRSKFPGSTTMISLLPLAMRMAGPREALLHTIIRKNYGATHFIVGRDHAGPGKDSKGQDFYGPYESQEMAERYASELGMQIVPFKMMVYIPSTDQYLPVDKVPKNTEYLTISGTELRERLNDGRSLPEWFTYPEVAEELRKRYLPRAKQGFCVFFTGLSGSGKSTVANALSNKLLELGGRQLTFLDGDRVRKSLSSELGFSKDDRDTNIKRIGFVAAEVSKHGGIAICAPIAPYDLTRKTVRRLVESKGGGFILVYINTPLATCEKRDRKGLYKMAREGKIKEFTGISDPYEVPKDADVTLDTEQYNPDELAQQILLFLEREGYIAASGL